MPTEIDAPELLAVPYEGLGLESYDEDLALAYLTAQAETAEEGTVSQRLAAYQLNAVSVFITANYPGYNDSGYEVHGLDQERTELLEDGGITKADLDPPLLLARAASMARWQIYGMTPEEFNVSSEVHNASGAMETAWHNRAEALRAARYAEAGAVTADLEAQDAEHQLLGIKDGGALKQQIADAKQAQLTYAPRAGTTSAGYGGGWSTGPNLANQ